jgi:pyrimidine deaminase RibD-like protein
MARDNIGAAKAKGQMGRMFDSTKKHTERELMELATALAEESIPENDGRVHPLVGAVIARDGYVLATGYRGETPNAHAEEAALAKLHGTQAMGASVYTTLEPCTTRKKMPCTQWLITKGIDRVVIGMLDPNPDIRGQGEWLLETQGKSVEKFETDIVRKIKVQNGEFIDYMQGLGVTILSPQEGALIDEEPVAIHGTYRVRPKPGDNVVLFGRRDSIYYPQAPISWSNRSDARIWKCPRVWLSAGDSPQSYGIVVARVSEDFAVWLRSYTRVHEVTDHWIGAEMPTPPPGFEILASINVTRAPKKT